MSSPSLTPSISTPTAGGPFGNRILGFTAALWTVWISLDFVLARDIPSALHHAGFATARVGLVLFLIVFGVRPLYPIWKSTVSQFLLSHRRDLGLSFALTMGVHLVFVLGLPPFFGEAGWVGPDPITLVGGGIAYLFIALMAATSFASIRTWLTPRRWNQLHRTGAWIVWGVFFQLSLFSSLHQPGYAVVAGVLLGIALLRGLVYWQHRSQRSATAAQR